MSRQSMAHRETARFGWGLAVACTWIATWAVLAGCASGAQSRAADPPNRIEAVRLTAAGHYIDLRYRVTDPARANEMLGPGVRPVLVNEANGAVMAVPMTAKLGPLRQTQAKQKTDHLYFVMFVNSGAVVPGSTVTAQLGDIRIAHLTVQ